MQALEATSVERKGVTHILENVRNEWPEKSSVRARICGFACNNIFQWVQRNRRSSLPAISGRAALEAAKRKRVHQQASLRSEIICGDGEGRATREYELIWSPIFDSSDNSILTLRVYVGKVHLWDFLCYSYIAYDKINLLKLTMFKRRQQNVY